MKRNAPFMTLVVALWALGMAAGCSTPQPTPTPTLTVPPTATSTPLPTPTPQPTSTPLPTPTPTPIPLADWVAEGDALLQRSDFAGAEAAYKKAIAADARYVPARIALSRAYAWQINREKEALAEAQQAVELAPENVLALAALAEAHYWRDDSANALKQIKKAATLDAKNARVQSVLARAYLLDRQYEPAYQAAVEAVTLAPKSAEAYHVLGLVHWERKDFARARAALEQAVALEPQFVTWRDVLAGLLTYLQLYDQATQELQKAQEIAPDHVPTLFRLAELHIQQRAYDKAEPLIEKAVQAMPDAPEPHLLWGDLLIAQEKYKEATAKFQEAVERDPDDLWAQVGLADVRIRLGECESAAAAMQTVSASKPRFAQPLISNALAKYCLGDTRRALETIRQAIELEPYNAEAHLILADLYSEQERWKEATQSYIRALRFSPVGVAAQSGLGQVYLYQDQSQPAEAQFQVVVSLDPKAVDGYAGLCTIYLQQDKTAKALPQCEQAATLDEKSADRRRQWANALLREGRPQEAAKILQALVDEDPEDDLGHYLLGLAYRDLKEYADAQTEIEIYQDLSGSDDFRIQVLIGALKESYVLRQDKAIADLAQFGESVLKYPVNVQVETTGGLTRTLTIRFRAQKGEEPQQTYQSMFSLAGIAAMIAPRVEPAFNGGTLIRAETAQGQPFLTLRFAARDLSAFLDGFLSSQQFVAKMQFVPEPSDTKGGELTDKDFKATTDGIATLRGLAAKKPVGFQRLTQQALEERLQGRMDTKAREASQHSQALLRLLGVIGPDVDLEKLSQDLAAEQVLGFYDYEKQTFYVVGGKAASSVADRLVIAHEYVHALQDQNFGMGEILRKEENGDRRLALSALIEGDASLSSYTYIQTETPIQDQVQLFSLSQGGIQKEALEASPPVLRDSLVFPYSQGLTFVTSIHEAGGWKAVNELYGKPPASTEQILHPERYRKGDAPVDVSLPDVAAALGGDWRLVDDDLMGELGWRLTLTAYLGPATAEVAAEGWGGDDYALLQQGSTETYALVLNTVFDEEAEAEEFWALLRVALDHRAGYTQIVKDLTGADPARQWRGAGDYWVARRAGKSVLIVIGPSEEVTQKLLAVAAGS